MEYRILTNPKYPVFDPNIAWWHKLLGFLRVIPRPLFVVLHPTKPLACTHPANVEATKRFFAERGIHTTTGPLLVSLDGEKQ